MHPCARMLFCEMFLLVVFLAQYVFKLTIRSLRNNHYYFPSTFGVSTLFHFAVFFSLVNLIPHRTVSFYSTRCICLLGWWKNSIAILGHVLSIISLLQTVWLTMSLMVFWRGLSRFLHCMENKDLSVRLFNSWKADDDLIKSAKWGLSKKDVAPPRPSRKGFAVVAEDRNLHPTFIVGVCGWLACFRSAWFRF